MQERLFLATILYADFRLRLEQVLFRGRFQDSTWWK